MDTKDKNELLDELSVCYNRINYCKILCEEKGQIDEAKQFERRSNRLKLEIDGLLQDLYHNWIGEANSLKSKIDKLNKKIKENIEDIENDIETAQTVVKVIGYFDNVVRIAADLVL